MSHTKPAPPRPPLGQTGAAKVNVTRQRIVGSTPLDVAAFQSFAE